MVIYSEFPYLAHGVRIFRIDILEDAGDLALQLELTALDEIETRSVYDGEHDTVEAGFTYLDGRGLNGLSSLGVSAQELRDRSALVGSRGGRDVGRFQKKPKERSLAIPLRTDHLHSAILAF